MLYFSFLLFSLSLSCSLCSEFSLSLIIFVNLQLSESSECFNISELLGDLGGLLSELGQGSVNYVLCVVLLSSVSRLELLFS